MDTADATMKCVLVQKHGGKDAFDEIISMCEAWPRPRRGNGQLLLRVQACSLAPGDVRTMSGLTKLAQTPKSGFPYVPGGDVVGIVEEPDPDCGKFKAGDRVVCRFHDVPSGGLGEYCVSKTSLAALVPAGLSTVEAAALPASVVVAVIIVRTWVQRGDRVLVLGATGGVGSHVVQLLKGSGASFVAATAHIIDRLDPKDVDRKIAYSEEDWWEVPEFQCEKFDLILDFAAFPDAWSHCALVLKSGKQGGRFITTAGDSPTFPVLGCCDIVSLLHKMFWRRTWTSWITSAPQYHWFMGGLADPITDATWEALFEALRDGRLRVVVDPAGPFPFSEAGVRDAFRLQESRHAHGKVVIKLVDDTKP